MSRILANRSGASLVEMGVVIVLMSAISVAVLGIFSAVYRATVDTDQRLDQISRSEDLLGGLNALLAATPGSDLGQTTAEIPALDGPDGAIPATEPGILPTSLAGDQLTFAAGGRCYRIFYRQSDRAIWLASADQCSALAQAQTGLQRGPNQFPETFLSSSPLYDPVLDSVTEDRLVAAEFVAYPLVTGIIPLDQEPIFTYRFRDLQAAATDLQAQLGSSNPTYQEIDTADLIAVEAQFAVLGEPTLPLAQQRVSPKEYRQELFIGQFCPRS